MKRPSHQTGPMHVGACRITLHLHASQSLKDKRSTVKSVLARLHREMNVAAAEVDTHDLWQIATIGVVCVSNNAARVDEVLAKAVQFVERSAPEAELMGYETEVQQAF